jgi:hypothetical protein
MRKSLVNAALVQQHDETARYRCESAPNYTGKKKGATPQFHVVALLELAGMGEQELSRDWSGNE